MMKALYKLEGSQFRIDILAQPQMQDFIETHSSVLDSGFQQTEMSDAMRRRLQRSDYIFSGIKTFHELNEAFPSLLDENGNRKPFERFLNDVRKIDRTYNENYLRSEYNFVQASAEMAAKWEQFQQDGDRYYLQYRTQHDDKVRPEHAALDRVTLPIDDPFWEEYYPPNGWNCRCTVVQVRKSKYQPTPHDQAMALGEQATGKDTKGIFHFNPGIEQKTVPDYNPYTIRRCRDCDINKEKLAFVPDNELCAACRMVRALLQADTKQIKKQARETIQGITLSHPDFKFGIQVSRSTIDEWTNQPHAHMADKNRMILRIQEVLAKAKYLGRGKDNSTKPGSMFIHLFETQIKGDKSWIIVKEYSDNNIILYSISDSPNILKALKEK